MGETLRKRAFLLIAASAASLILCAAPARSQLSAFSLPTPASTRAVGGRFPVRWVDRFVGGLDPGCLYSVTWYYAANKTGEDKKRLTTVFRDDFTNGFRANWSPQGQFIFDWDVRQERDSDRRYLVAPKLAGPALSKDGFESNVVVSALVRPIGTNPEFGIALRVQPNGRGIELQSLGGVLGVTQAGKPFLHGQRRLTKILPNDWYWFEIGIMNKKRSRDIEVRVRVYDERRERVLAEIGPVLDQPLPGLDKPGLLQLVGPAHFAEIHVDPWSARWVDDWRNELIWNTELVADGDYFLVAEVADGKGPPRSFVSDYQVQVRNMNQAAAGN